MDHEPSPNRKVDDAARLMPSLCRGDREAFLKVIRLYQKKVFQMAYGFFGNREDALDIVQETFLRVHEKADTFDQDRSLQNWVLQVAKNICIDYYRKNYRKRKELESKKPLDELDPAAEPGPPPGEAADLQRILGLCVDKLTVRQRTIFVMRHFQELRNEEIARTLNISLGTVKSLHFKAVQNLRSMLAPYLEAQP